MSLQESLQELAPGNSARLARHVRIVVQAMEQDKQLLLEELCTAQVDLGHAEGELAAVRAQHHALAEHCGLGANHQEALERERATTGCLREQISGQQTELHALRVQLQEATHEALRAPQLELELSEAKKAAAHAKHALFQETQSLERLRAASNQQQTAIQEQEAAIAELQHTMELQTQERVPGESESRIHSLQCELAEARSSLHLCWRMQKEGNSAEVPPEPESERQRQLEAELAELRIQAHLAEQRLQEERRVAQENSQLVSALQERLGEAEQEAEAAKRGLEGEFAGEWEALREDLVGQLQALQRENALLGAQQAAHQNPSCLVEAGCQTAPQEGTSPVPAEDSPPAEELMGLWLAAERLRAQLHTAEHQLSLEESRVFVAEEAAISAGEQLEKREFELALRRVLSSVGLQLSGRAELWAKGAVGLVQWRLKMESHRSMQLGTRLHNFQFQIEEERTLQEELRLRQLGFGRWLVACGFRERVLTEGEGSLGTPNCGTAAVRSLTPSRGAEEQEEDLFFQELMRPRAQLCELSLEQQRILLSEHKPTCQPRVLVFD